MGGSNMEHSRIVQPMEKALRFYAVLALALVLFQGLGLAMYVSNAWPGVRDGSATGIPLSTATTLLLVVAVFVGVVRSLVWIKIYWDGSKVFSCLRLQSDSPDLAEALAPLLASLTRLLIASFVLDVLFLPAFFLSDVVFSFPIAGWRLGAVELARILFPQAFGSGALFLAFLTHQYGRLVRERSRMQHELDLTI